MHTHTTHRHRHFVAVPVTVLATLFLAGVSSLLPVRAEERSGAMSVHLQAENEEQFAIGIGVVGTLGAGSTLRAQKDGMHIAMVRGQALFAIPGYTVVDIGNVQVHAVQTSFFLVQDQRITVAALEQPLIALVGEKPVIVFAGQQLSVSQDGSTSLSALPDEWRAKHRHEARTLLNAHNAATRNLTFDELFERLHVSASPTERRLLLLRLAVLAGRTDEMQTDAIVRAFRTDPVLQELFPTSLPALALTSQAPLPPALISAWADRVILLGLRDGTGASLLVRGIAMLPGAVEQAGYPLQAETWRQELRRTVEALRSVVSAANGVVLVQARERFSAENIVLVPRNIEKEKDPEPLTSWTAEELSALTRHALVSYGALIATSTAFVSDTATQTVRVQGIFVAENGRDVPYSFTFDPAKEVLRAINRDGELLPNAVPIGVFFR